MTKDEAYRDSIQFFGLTPKNGFKAGKLYSYKPITGTGDFTCTRSTTAYRTAQDGELELMAINTPRVDYANTCPQLLIEDSSTNLLIRSQEFDNASWTKVALTVTANSIAAPDGTTTSDTITLDVGTASKGIAQILVAGANVIKTFSIFAKAGTHQIIQLQIDSTTSFCNFDLLNGTKGIPNNCTANIELINGFYLCSITYTSVQQTPIVWAVDSLSSSDAAVTSSTGSFYIWGGQLETGSIATSYIPTTTTTVTRGADVIKNDTLDYTSTALSVFLRVRLDNTGSPTVRNLLYLYDDPTGDYVGLWADADNKITFTTYDDTGGDQNDFQSGSNANEITNIAFSIDLVAKTYCFVINGVEQFTGTITNDLPSTFDIMYLGMNNGVDYAEKDGIIGVMYFDTELTGAELQALTV